MGGADAPEPSPSPVPPEVRERQRRRQLAATLQGDEPPPAQPAVLTPEVAARQLRARLAATTPDETPATPDETPATQPPAALAPGARPVVGAPAMPRDLSATIRDEEASTSESSDSGSEISSESIGKPALGTAGATGDQRYAVTELLGRGATSQVFGVQDRTFERAVALKFLHAQRAMDSKRIARFMREAKITARLEHPHIAPVYDMDFTGDGGIYFTMRMIKGASLGDAIRALADGRPLTGAASLYERVGVILRVCEALACAHERRIVHRDVKPDNIMLGRFGEVVLVDWGAALVLDEDARPDRLIGTPNYMAPEQARIQPVDARCDVYSVGATLFHALLLRPPTSGRDEDDFWARKRAGAIDPIADAERRRVPPALLAVAMKALAPDPAARYQRIGDLAADLVAWQSGLVVSAYRERLDERLRRWHRAHARALWTTVAVAAVVLVAAALLWGERLKDMAAWGSPVLVEDFRDEGWRDRWEVWGGGFAVDRGRLTATGPKASVLFLRQRLVAPVAIEYDASFAPGAPPGDCSVLWSTVDPTNPDTHVPGRDEPYRLLKVQAGAYDNTCALIVGPDGQRWATAATALASDRPHRLRIEIDGEQISLAIDGRRILAARSEMTLGAGWIGLYGYYPGKQFADLRIWTRRPAQRVSALAIGDTDLREGRWTDAVRHYREVAEAHAGHALASEALYRAGLAQRLGGDHAAAAATWAEVPDGRWRDRVEIHRLEDLAVAADWAAFMPALRRLYPAADDDIRLRARRVWGAAIVRCIALGRRPPEPLVALGDELFGAERDAAPAHAEALLALRRYDELFARHPDQVDSVVQALLRLGRADEILQRFPAQRLSVARALLAMGRFDEIRAMDPPVEYAIALLTSLSRPDRMLMLFERYHRGEIGLDAFPTGDLDWMQFLLDDRAELAVAESGDPRQAARMRLLRGTWSATDAQGGWSDLDTLAQELAVIDALARGRTAEARELVAASAAGRRDWFHEEAVAYPRMVVRPVAIALGLDRAAGLALLERTSAEHRWHWQQRPWHSAAWLLGHIDDQTFLRQPVAVSVDGQLALLRAMRADLEGEREHALALYRSWLALPPWQRSHPPRVRDPVAEALVRWRLQALMP